MSDFLVQRLVAIDTLGWETTLIRGGTMTADAAPGPAQTAPAVVAPAAGVPMRRPTARASPATLRLYAADWTAFETWCAGAGRAALPADAATVAAFLADAVPTLSPGALARRASAIGRQHRQHGVASPTADPAVKAVLRAARQTANPRQRPRPTPAQLRRMAAACGGDLTGLRDRALLLLAAGGLGPAALVGLDVEHVAFAATAATVTPQGAGVSPDRLAVLAGADRGVCPIQALRDWLQVSHTSFGPVFRKIDRWGNIEHRRLVVGAVRAIVVRRTPRRARRTFATTAP
jgi:integrase